MNYRIAFQSDQWVVQKKTEKRRETAPTVWRNVAYHNQLRFAVSWVLERLVGEAVESVECTPEGLEPLQWALGYIQENLKEIQADLLAIQLDRE